MNTVVAHTTFSRRVGYFEPYGMLSLLAEWQQGRGVFGTNASLDGPVLTRPPIVASSSIGTEVVPWEQRDQFRRLVIDARLTGTYSSPGRDYTELFDALGTSQARSLRTPNPGAYTSGPNGSSVPDTTKPDVYFTGVTGQQGFGTLGGKLLVTYQAGEYVKFTSGLGLTFAQPHAITATEACNPAFVNDQTKAGPCRTADPTAPITGIPDPYHRAVIDLPGHRFVVDDSALIDFWLNAIVMF
jgi:hypothetical protein